MFSNVRTLFLQSICAIYLVSFVGFYVEIPGLIGSHGILPCSQTLKLSENLSTISEQFVAHPTLLWFHKLVGISAEHFVECLALAGIILSSIGYIFISCCNTFLFLILWLIYKSLCDSGPVFYSQIFDHLLLETGFLCIFLAPVFKPRDRLKIAHPADKIILWLLRWLLVRVTVSITISRLISPDSSNEWWNINAIRSYLQSVPVPIDLTLLAYQAPIWVHKTISVLFEVSSIVSPILYFMPVQSIRQTVFWIQIALQLLAIFTMNFGPFHLILIVLHFVLFDQVKNKQKWFNFAITLFSSIVCLLIYATATIFMFNLRLINGIFVVKRNFTPFQMRNYLSIYLLAIIIIASVSFIETISTAMYQAIHYKYPQHSSIKKEKKRTPIFTSKPIVIFSTFNFAFIAFFLFYVTIISMQTIEDSQAMVKLSPRDTEIIRKLSDLHIVHKYEEPIKLFKTDANGRPEIVFEVSYDSDKGPWTELQFNYKPGKLDTDTQILVPFAPRLNYQLWQAVRSDFQSNPWLMSLVYRLLQDSSSVNQFLTNKHFKSPKFIKGSLYQYQFNINKLNTKNHWKRSRKSNYFIIFNNSHDKLLLDMLRDSKIEYPFKNKASEQPIAFLTLIRHFAQLVSEPVLTWSLFISAFLFKTII